MPHVTPCVIDYANSVAYCAHSWEPEQVIERQISEIDGYTCFSPDDLQALLEAIKRKTHK